MSDNPEQGQPVDVDVNVGATPAEQTRTDESVPAQDADVAQSEAQPTPDAANEGTE